MKKTLDELKVSFGELIGDDERDEVIAFLEDLSDSFEPEDAELRNRVTVLEGKLSELKKRYKDRFFGRMDDETEEEEIVTDEKPDGDTIKIKDLFKEERKD